jgi:hypothetical protein
MMLGKNTSNVAPMDPFIFLNYQFDLQNGINTFECIQMHRHMGSINPTHKRIQLDSNLFSQPNPIGRK